MMYSIFNISTSSQFRTRPYGWCGPSEHAEWQWFCRKWKQAILQLFSSVFSYFSPVCSYSRQCSIILAIKFLYSVIQLFSPLCFVQSAVYILSRPSVPGKVNFRNLLEHILISKANDSAKIKTKQKNSSIGMLSVSFSAPEPGIREV